LVVGGVEALGLVDADAGDFHRSPRVGVKGLATNFTNIHEFLK
jgi:hypothetical protein